MRKEATIGDKLNKMNNFLKKVGKKLVCFKNYCYLCPEIH